MPVAAPKKTKLVHGKPRKAVPKSRIRPVAHVSYAVKAARDPSFKGTFIQSMKVPECNPDSTTGSMYNLMCVTKEGKEVRLPCTKRVYFKAMNKTESELLSQMEQGVARPGRGSVNKLYEHHFIVYRDEAKVVQDFDVFPAKFYGHRSAAPKDHMDHHAFEVQILDAEHGSLEILSNPVDGNVELAKSLLAKLNTMTEFPAGTRIRADMVVEESNGNYIRINYTRPRKDD